MREITPHMKHVLDVSEKKEVYNKQNKSLNSNVMPDLILEAILKVGKKQNVNNKILLIKRYLRRYYNIDMSSKTVKSRLENLTK
jgi:hypothetical protein